VLLSLSIVTPASASTNCQAELLVTTPQTVGFYFGVISTSHFIGYANVGQWLHTNTLCLNHDYVHVIVWDNQGREHEYRTKQKYTNVNTMVTVIYPQDFNHALSEQTTVICRIHILNNSDNTTAFFVKNAFTSHQLVTLAPWQEKLVTAPCFTQEKIVAKRLQKNSHGVLKATQKYKSIQKYDDVNTVPYLSFPDAFKEAGFFS
tara:strand:- start:653 stop:1264 length:612 start_codon:yes stop_codon:yes gene_type:complete